MNILLICSAVPYPPNRGYALRVYNLIKRGAGQHNYYLYICPYEDADEDDIAYLKQMCKGVVVEKRPVFGTLEKLGLFLKYLIRGIPPDLGLYSTEQTPKKLAELIKGVPIDIVQVEDSYLGLYREYLPANLHAKTVLVFHDLVYRQYERMYKLEKVWKRRLRYWLHACLMRRWEPSYSQNYDLSIVMSQEDQKLLQLANPRLKVEVVPNGVDTSLYQPMPFEEGKPAFVFVGNMNYNPNVDAVRYFVHEILPEIRKKAGEVYFWIVGVNPRDSVMALAGDNVYVTGKVEDVRPYYQRSQVCVVPLRAGGGTRLKILEAMALGRPVVSTSIGCEGLEVTDGKNILIADDPRDFANKVIQVINSKIMREYISNNARQLVETQYNWDVIAQKYLHLLAALTAREY